METIYSQLKAQETKLKDLGSDRINIKAAGTMLAANVTGSTITHIDAQQIAPINIMAEESIQTADYFPKIMCDSHSIVLSNMTGEDNDGTFSSVAEGAAKEDVDYDIAATQKSFTKYAATVKVSEEMLADIPYLQSQIEGNLKRRLKNKIGADFLAAIMAATPNVVNTNLTTGQLATKLRHLFPAIYAGLYIQKGYKMNLWMLNDPEYTKLFSDLDATVDTAWFDLYKPTIVPSASVTSTKIFACDTNMFPIYIYKDISIEIGRENDDFTKNLVSINGEARVAWNIAGECLNALYNDVITTTITRI
jgi:hypothetical protein